MKADVILDKRTVSHGSSDPVAKMVFYKRKDLDDVEGLPDAAPPTLADYRAAMPCKLVRRYVRLYVRDPARLSTAQRALMAWRDARLPHCKGECLLPEEA